ncbi:hypothetical protein BDR05DRAFT_968967 [Suillus weaverae]|nr:hypothetical protein BDR05DRAFT_968967 [Suillus weaverae]
MMKLIPENTALLDALSKLKQSQAMKPQDPHSLKDTLAFLIQTMDPLSVLGCLLWLRGDRSSVVQRWLVWKA